MSQEIELGLSTTEPLELQVEENSASVPVNTVEFVSTAPPLKLWTIQQVNLFQELLQHLKYTDDEAGEIAAELLASLETNPDWNSHQVDLFDDLLDHVRYTTDDGGHYADLLIASLRGEIVDPTGSVTLSQNGTYDVRNYASAVVDTPTYTDGDEVEY